MKKTKTEDNVVTLQRLDVQEVTLAIWGISPLVMNKWSEKAVNEMLSKQMKKAKPGKEAKDPQACFEAAIHRDEYGFPCFPAVGLKASAVNAAIAMGLKMTHLRQAFHIDAETVPILSDKEPEMNQSMVRVGMGVADVRFRPLFRTWGTIVTINLNKGILSVEQLVNLYNAAGFGIGIGEHRPQKNGQWGRYRNATEAETELLKSWLEERNKEVKKLKRKAA